MNNREFFLQRWEQEQPKFQRVIDAIPADRLDYRPHPKSQTAGGLVTKLAREQQILNAMLDTGQVDYKEPQEEPFEKMKTLWKDSTEKLRGRLKKLDDDGWERPVKFLLGGKLGNEAPTGEMLWGFLADMIHHRGQLSTYIRPMGGKVPSIYGPSADAGPE